MSGSNDQLKSMFDEAFAAEQIAFDMGAWHQMEAMLNQRTRRRGLWIWLLGIGLATGLSSWLLLNDLDQNLYQPRLISVAFDHDLSQNSCTSRSSAGTAPASNNQMTVAGELASNDAPTDARSTLSPTVKTSQSYTSPKNIEHMAATPSSNEGSMTPITEVDDGHASDIAISAVAEYGTDVADLPLEDQTRDRITDLLEFMPIAQVLGHNSKELQDEESEPKSSLSRDLIYYARAGFSKTLFHKPLWFHPALGQSGGLGIQYQFKNHWLVSSEIGIARMMFSDTAQLTGPTTYGYSRNENSYAVSTSELLYAEIPLMVHYRMNRLQIGAGLSVGYLVGLKTQTTHTVSQSDGSGVVGTQGGWYRWNRYRSFQTSLIGDIQYQLASGAILGLRESFGLQNISNVDDKSIQASRFEIYLKLQLK